MDHPAYKLDKGSLLVASPEVSEGLFFRSVILICEHTKAGSFGLIINKPFQVEFSPELMQSPELSHPKVKLRLGGKMQQTQMLLLHSSAAGREGQTLQVLDGVYLGGDLQFLQEALQDDRCSDILICFGYSSWISGELEKELLSGLWLPCPGADTLVFQTEPEKIWQTSLQQMGGKYGSIAMIPEDLSLN